MFKSQCTKFADVLIDRKICKNEDREIIVYGLAFGIEIVLNMITTIVLASIFRLLMESIVFFISFSLIRIYAGGYHCKKAINCYFFSSATVVLMLSMVRFTPEGYILVVSIIMVLISVPIILKLAPVETETKPLDEVETKFFRTKTILHLSVECVVITVLLLFELYILGYIICIGIAVSALFILLNNLMS